jgi:indolepyruvate ferredoxin oxidoreductase beta subunit
MNVVITGVGGQGTVLASRLVAYMGMEAGLPVRTAETIGMAQRGGCVTSHVRIGADPDDLIASPLVPQGTADLVLAFEPGEGTRALSYLSETGGMVVSSRPIIPVTASLASGGYDPEAHLAYLTDRLGDRLVVVDPAVLAGELGSDRALNVTMLGVAVRSGALTFTRDQLESAVRQLVKPRFVDMNLSAIALGERIFDEYHEQMASS